MENRVIFSGGEPNNKTIAKKQYALIDRNYQEIPTLDPQKIEERVKEYALELGTLWQDILWKDIPGWRISGAPAISLLTQDYSRPHTNGDIAILSDLERFKEMVERAKKNRLYLFRRERTFKWLPSHDSPKHHIIYPQTPEEVIDEATNYKKPNRNLFLLRVGKNGEIVLNHQENNWINLFMHETFEPAGLRSLEDGLEFDRYFFKVNIAIGGINVPVMNPKYLYERKLALIAKGNTKPKHEYDLKLLEPLVQHHRH
ncbi:MAG: hypothetical protein AABX11_01945 [Nanoarchaeota archaeon]